MVKSPQTTNPRQVYIRSREAALSLKLTIYNPPLLEKVEMFEKYPDREPGL